MYQNPYMPNYSQNMNQQSINDRIDNQIAQLQQMKEQMKNANHQPAINQTFQLAPNSTGGIKYSNTIDDVNKEIVYGDTPFFSKDMSVVWVKNVKGDIKTYELKEIVPLDEKDMQIQYLQSQIEELKGMIKNEQFITNDISKQNATDTSKLNESNGNATKKSKSTSVSKVSGSKEE